MNNNFFKLFKRWRKHKSNDLQRISTQLEFQAYDEVRAIYKRWVLMGLFPVQNEEMMIAYITEILEFK